MLTNLYDKKLRTVLWDGICKPRPGTWANRWKHNQINLFEEIDSHIWLWLWLRRCAAWALRITEKLPEPSVPPTIRRWLSKGCKLITQILAYLCHVSLCLHIPFPRTSLARTTPSCHRVWTHPRHALMSVLPASTEPLLLLLPSLHKREERRAMSDVLFHSRPTFTKVYTPPFIIFACSYFLVQSGKVRTHKSLEKGSSAWTQPRPERKESLLRFTRPLAENLSM